MKTIYFAHPYDTWKTEMEYKIMGVLSRQYMVINPFDTEQGLNKKYGTSGYYEKPSLPFAHDIVKTDYELLSTCDEYFGWFPEGITLVGTVVEMLWACKHGKLVTTLCYKPNPFLLAYSDKFYLGFEDLVENRPFSMPKKPDVNAAYYVGFKKFA